MITEVALDAPGTGETDEQREAKEAEAAAAQAALEELKATNSAEAELELGKAFLAVWGQEPGAATDDVARRSAKTVFADSRFQPF